ncbi:putative phospholipid-transporting ATPase IM [Manis javanica]|nr:putative phospholipid-transporting ATPase IM [Manis javanica]
MWTANVSSSWLAGFTVCLSLIVSIGAQNLYVLRQAVQGRHVHACVLWCVLSDAVLIGLGVAGMAQLLGDNPDLARYLTLGGALFLLAYGLIALWRMAMAPDAQLAASGGQLAPRGLLGGSPRWP